MLIRWLMAVGLALGADYGAWRASMSASSDIPALVTGLVLAVLGVAFAWLVVLCVLEVGLWCGRTVGDRRSASRLGAAVGDPATGGRAAPGAPVGAPRASRHQQAPRESQSDRLAA